jgi:hypothetical protein
MQREIKKKNMYQAASYTGDLGEAGFLLALARRDERGRAGSGTWQGGCVRDRHRTS